MNVTCDKGEIMLRRSFLGLLPVVSLSFFGLKKKERELRFVTFGTTKQYFDENNEVYLHVLADGKKHWFKNGRLHREDGPAKEFPNGEKFWLQNGQLHRVDGPACEYLDGTKCWYQNGQRHRDGGPAVECSNGTKSWYKNGRILPSRIQHRWV